MPLKLSLGFFIREGRHLDQRGGSVRKEEQEVMFERQPAVPTTELSSYSSAYCVPALSMHYLINFSYQSYKVGILFSVNR